MRFKIYVWLWALWAWSLSVAGAATARMEVRALPFADALPSLDITALYQDREGLMWVGTRHGLACYNGSATWVAGKHHDTLWRMAGAEVTAIADTRRHVYVGTQQGLGVYDKYGRTLRAAPVAVLASAPIRCLYADSHDHLWVAVADSLLCCDDGLHTLHSFKLPMGVVSMYEDSHQRLWVLTWEGGLWRLDPTRQQLVPYPKLGSRNNPFVMCEDSRQRLWIGTWGDGVYRFCPEADAPYMYRFQHEVGAIVFDLEEVVPDKELWALTYDSLAVLGYDSHSDVLLESARQPLEGQNRSFSTMMRDREGNIWCGALGGGCVACPVSQLAEGNTLPWIEARTGFASNLNALVTDVDGVVWLNQERAGLMLYNPADGHYNLHPYAQPKAFEMGLITRDGPRSAWMASPFVPWVFRAERRGMDLHYTDTLKLADGHIRALEADGHGLLWVLTQNGVRLFGPAMRELTAQCPVAAEVTAICRQPDGRIWTATRSGHLLLWRDTAQGPEVQSCYVLNALRGRQEVPCRLTSYADGCLWIATGQGGLWHFTSQGRCLRRLTDKYLSGGEPVLNLVAGGGVAWLVQPLRAVALHPDGPSATPWAVGQEGLPVRSFRGTAAHVLPDGRLVAGGYGGMVTLSPSTLQAPPHTARVYVTSALPPQGSRQPDAALPMPLLCDTLYIQGPSARFILSACLLAGRQEARYAVQLEPTDKAPRVLQAGADEVTYHDLKPRTYRLHLWLADTQGRIQGQPHSYVVQVRPARGAAPGPWGYAAAAMLLVAVLCYALWRRRQSRIQAAPPPAAKESEPPTPRQLITHIIKGKEGQPDAAVPAPQGMTLTLRDYDLLCRIVGVTLSHLDDSSFDLDSLTEALGTSRSTLSRRLKTLCALTPMDVVRVVRLEVACRLLGQGGMNVSETAYAVGYTDPKYFARCFKEEFGVSPSRLSARQP